MSQLQKTIILLVCLGSMFMSTRAKGALCIKAAMFPNKCLRCYQGLLNNARACVDPKTSISNCGFYKKDGVCRQCAPRFVKILEASSAETPGQCVPTSIPNCIRGVKRLDGEFCWVCDKGFIPALGRKECVVDEKTLRNARKFCEWNHRWSRCAKCTNGHGFGYYYRVVKYIRADGSVRIFRRRHRRHRRRFRRRRRRIRYRRFLRFRHRCSEFPKIPNYDWSGCLAHTTRTTIVFTFSGYKVIKKGSRVYKVSQYKRSETTATFCSKCDGAQGYFQASDKAACSK